MPFDPLKRREFITLIGGAATSVKRPGLAGLGTSTGAFGGLGGDTATLQNISGTLPISNFLAIPALPQAQVTLNVVGPGSSNTNCAALTLGGCRFRKLDSSIAMV